MQTDHITLNTHSKKIYVKIPRWDAKETEYSQINLVNLTILRQERGK